MKKAKDIMTPHPEVCTVTDTVRRAVEIMSTENCGVVPIVDENHRCVGVITDRDICLAVVLQGFEPNETRVGDIMTESPYTCQPEDALETVIQCMEDNQIRRVPIVDEAGQCVGIISQADIALEAEEKTQVSELVEQISR